jgi:large subunit ribosomal protein L22
MEEKKMEEKKMEEKKEKHKDNSKEKLIPKNELKENKGNEKDLKSDKKNEVKNKEEAKQTKNLDKNKLDSKKIKKIITKKEEAIAKSNKLPISKKHATYICNFIKGKKIDESIFQLNEVLKFKRAIPFKGEIPHRKGKGIMSGRYPIKAVQNMINILKALKGNVIVNGMDLEKIRIYIATSSWSSRPLRRGNRKSKRTNVILKAKEFPEVKK